MAGSYQQQHDPNRENSGQSYQYGQSSGQGFGTGPGAGQSSGQGVGSGQGYRYSRPPGSGQGGYYSNGSKTSGKSWNSGSWVGMLVLFCIPFWITKVIAVIWFFKELAAMDKRQRKKYRDKAKWAAKNGAEAAADFSTRAARWATDFSAKAEQWAADFSAKTGQGAAKAGQGQTAAGSAPVGEQSAPAGKQSASVGEQSAPTAGKKTERATARSDGWDVRGSGTGRNKNAWKRARDNSSLALIIPGIAVTGVFGVGALALAIILNAFAMDGRWGWPEWGVLIGLASCLAFLAGGIGTLCAGIKMRRRNERYMDYLAYIGANREVSLAHMAATFGLPVKKLCKDLRRMLSKGILPTGYLDLAEGKLYLTEMGYRQPESQRRAEPEETPQQAADRESEILREIRQVNDEIPDEVMSAKIDRIEEITSKIFAYQKAHPHKEGQLRSFLNYYLPTTLKILRAYAQLDAQGIEGENISAAKKRIEDMMDQVVFGFEKQLDKLFRDDAMDITSDVQVLENMLKKDGLSDDEGITMTL